jgi:hypothetical protein
VCGNHLSGIGADVKCRIASVLVRSRNGLLSGCKAVDGGDDTVVPSWIISEDFYKNWKQLTYQGGIACAGSEVGRVG